jgi:outer membrane protein assembly factor BamB
MISTRWTTGVIAAVLLCLYFAAASQGAQPASDWPQWRGPNRDAICAEAGLLKEWPAEGPKLEWELRGLGTGFSTIAIVGDKFFTMGDLPDGGQKSQFVMAFDLNTRQQVWKTKVGPPHNDGSRCTPTVDDGLVYVIGTEGDLLCVNASDGKEVWRKNFPKDFGGKMMSGWKFSESPLIDGDKLICTPGGEQAALAALNKKTGETIWKCAPPNPKATGGAAYCSIVVSEAAGVRQYVTIMGRGAVGVSAADGKFLWSYGKVANGTANIVTPVVTGDFVFVSTAYNTGSALLKLSKTPDGVKAEEVYFLKASTFQCHHGGFLRIGDYIFGADGHNAGNPICIELATGKVAWRENQIGGGSGCVLYADGQLYYRYDNDTVVLIEANPAKYVLKSSFKMPRRPGFAGPGWSHPVIHGGKLFIRHADVLMCYDIKSNAG